MGDMCKRCGRYRGLIDGLCDDCTIALYGWLCPWLEKLSKGIKEKDETQ